jgi:hypothetical protein
MTHSNPLRIRAAADAAYPELPSGRSGDIPAHLGRRTPLLPVSGRLISDATAGCPRASGDGQASVRSTIPAAFVKAVLLCRIECFEVCARWAYAEREWLPPLVEAHVLDGDGERRLLDIL